MYYTAQREGKPLCGSSRSESLILSRHSRFDVACACHKEEINDADDGSHCEKESFDSPNDVGS